MEGLWVPILVAMLGGGGAGAALKLWAERRGRDVGVDEVVRGTLTGTIGTLVEDRDAARARAREERARADEERARADAERERASSLRDEVSDLRDQLNAVRAHLARLDAAQEAAQTWMQRYQHQVAMRWIAEARSRQLDAYLARIGVSPPEPDPPEEVLETALELHSDDTVGWDLTALGITRTPPDDEEDAP